MGVGGCLRAGLALEGSLPVARWAARHSANNLDDTMTRLVGHRVTVTTAAEAVQQCAAVVGPPGAPTSRVERTSPTKQQPGAVRRPVLNRRLVCEDPVGVAEGS